ncbi:hypothetical protein GORHZ_141_00260 [Gordonia rhizosphera NBRC 16068]|uniref:Mycothiol-dependent maleylpyruvate isomerase metal-binding domain-containing protein n=2 Tax=Gordonia rhizosphera TaxID=83341 RepID=K6WD42_9ACTN|nr:hypothetical protein GORHZ_141_00260 [Gordonia rhizosphera NBRC 16068]
MQTCLPMTSTARPLSVSIESTPSRPESIGDMLALRARATDDLGGQLAQHDDADPCWSWWPSDQTVGFTRRMQTYEATMHRVDAEVTASLPVSPGQAPPRRRACGWRRAPGCA